MQPHGLRHLRVRVLLALHEGDQRFALPEPFRLHLLGQEALVPEEETPVAAGDPGRGAAGDCPGGWNCRASDDYRYEANVC